jgi:signal transduction histidine kinase
MNTKSPPKQGQNNTIEYWKNEHDKKVFLINSMTSLLNRYGNSIEIENLYSVFLLTIMGQFVVGDACYFRLAAPSLTLEPVFAFGRKRKEEHPKLSSDSDFVLDLAENHFPRTLDSFSDDAINARRIKELREYYHVVAPLFLKEKLMGMLLLGPKISGKEYVTADFEVLFSLCAVSAATFNNSLLYRNAKHSAHEIQRLHDVRTEVINRITHEFRTPLTIIKGGIEILYKDEKYRDLCAMFFDSETRLEDLINSLLSLNERDGRADGTPVMTDPAKILHDVVHRYTNSKTGKNISFVLNQTPEIQNSTLRMRDSDLKMIVDSLLENAVKFSPEGSVVKLDVEIDKRTPSPEIDGLQIPEWRPQTQDMINDYMASSTSVASALDPLVKEQEELEAVSKTNTGEYFIIRISDSGIGIPEVDIPTVAEPFRQASNSPDVGIQGTGLGLAVVHKTVTKHGGYLCCKSSEGTGAIFSVFLPTEPSALRLN